ncbi:MAG TPA: transglycosylase family protein, partial [Microthrixaceae bacterium]|nr:transglycosylase family protein [Microthrixaceae bacterium]
NSVARAESALVRATADRIAAEARLGKAQSKLAAIEAKVARLGEANEKLTLELAQARESMREFAIAAYIDGGQSDIFRATLNPEKAQALAWQSNLSAGQATSADEVAHEYEELKAQNTPARLRAAEELERATQALADSKNDAIQAAAFERDAESALATAREAARVKAAEAASRAAEARSRADAERRASSSGSSSAVSASVSTNRAGSVAPSPPQPDQAADFESSARGNPSESESATLARIRRCESGGNYSIVSSSGRYRGAYQFDYRTWAGVGGSGDPAAASPAEQDYRALLLLRQRGTRPWPVCGR